ncbi:hypothetical protein RHSIM_Rhsim07G0225500 [Rhododendron simsii]|uniref:Mannose-P-dolichol utilization defect 1 protein homolog n=1 Tax=Rhododendron simsii TaxID=118357 RepID=A0A834LKH7_RHOSS|nr:hypothetical protein RHSIM_Rhsim07G0225500 [Rhododendron simsii]
MGVEMKFLGMNFSCAIGSLSDGKFPEKDCLLPLISKLLGYCIVAASTTVKLPQILKILQHQSVRGLSVMAFELELVGYTIALAYCLHKGLPFSAYGELAFLLIQGEVSHLVHFASSSFYNFSCDYLLLFSASGNQDMDESITVSYFLSGDDCSLTLYCGVAPTILAGQIDPVLFEALYASQHAIFFCARVPQIWQNYSNKSTGELSFLTCLMNSAGSLVRVFTSLQEKAPTSVVLGSVIGIVLNGTILSQIIMYQKPSQGKKEKKKD